MKKAQEYSDLSLQRPLTDAERKEYRKVMEQLFGKDNIRKALGE